MAAQEQSSAVAGSLKVTATQRSEVQTLMAPFKEAGGLGIPRRRMCGPFHLLGLLLGSWRLTLCRRERDRAGGPSAGLGGLHGDCQAHQPYLPCGHDPPQSLLHAHAGSVVLSNRTANRCCQLKTHAWVCLLSWEIFHWKKRQLAIINILQSSSTK